MQDRTAVLGDTLLKFQYDLNQSGDVRIVGTIDSFGNQKSYFNDLMKSNSNRYARVTNGLADPLNLVHLQVKGKNQLLKEIEET